MFTMDHTDYLETVSLSRPRGGRIELPETVSLLRNPMILDALDNVQHYSVIRDLISGTDPRCAVLLLSFTRWYPVDHNVLTESAP